MDLDNLSPEEVLAIAKEKLAEAEKLSKENQALTKTKTDLLIETKRRKKAAQLVDALGFDIKEIDIEEKAAEILNALEPNKQTAGAASTGTPSGEGEEIAQVNPEIAAAMKRMEQQIDTLKNAYQEAEQAKTAAIQQAEQEKLERMVIDKLTSAKCLRPQHVFKLTKDKYRFSEDKTSVISGDEYDPVSLDMVVGNLRENDEFSIYFEGSGMTGSGLQTSSSGGMPVTGDNPFHTSSKNATKAGALWNSNRERAKMLMAQARAAGKLVPEFASVFKD